MSVPNFPECQLPPPSVSDEPDSRQANNKISVLRSRGSRLEDDAPITPEPTSTTSVTKEEVEDGIATPMQERLLDDSVPVNRSDSFRNLSTLVAWEQNESSHLHNTSDSSLTRQQPQAMIDLPKCETDGVDIVAREMCSGPRFDSHNNADLINKHTITYSDEVAGATEAASVLDQEEDEEEEEEDEDFVIVESDGQSEKIPLRKRIMWKLRGIRNRNKPKIPRSKTQT